SGVQIVFLKDHNALKEFRRSVNPTALSNLSKSGALVRSHGYMLVSQLLQQFEKCLASRRLQSKGKRIHQDADYRTGFFKIRASASSSFAKYYIFLTAVAGE